MEFGNEEAKLGAILIDFDNIYVSLIKEYGYNQTKAQTKTIEIVNNTINHIGTRLKTAPIIKRAYADWSMYPDIPNELYTLGVTIGHVKAMRGKNSADIELSLSLLEIMLTRADVSVLVVLAGDRDYLPVARRVRERAKEIIFYSFEKCLSGDIKKLVGDENYWYIDPHKNRIKEKKVHKGKKKKSSDNELVKKAGKKYEPLLRAIPKKGITVSSLARELGKNKEEVRKSVNELSGRGIISTWKVKRWTKCAILPELDEDMRRALRSAIKADEEYGPKYGHVKLSGFEKDLLEKALPGKSHLERKEIFNSLVDYGLITLETEYYPWGVPFFVFLVNSNHPLVKREAKMTGSQNKSSSRGR